MLDELWPTIKRQPVGNKRRLQEWLQAGVRLRDELDRLYDEARYLSEEEVAELIRRLGA